MNFQSSSSSSSSSPSSSAGDEDKEDLCRRTVCQHHHRRCEALLRPVWKGKRHNLDQESASLRSSVSSVQCFLWPCVWLTRWSGELQYPLIKNHSKLCNKNDQMKSKCTKVDACYKIVFSNIELAACWAKTSLNFYYFYSLLSHSVQSGQKELYLSLNWFIFVSTNYLLTALFKYIRFSSLFQPFYLSSSIHIILATQLLTILAKLRLFNPFNFTLHNLFLPFIH